MSRGRSRELAAEVGRFVRANLSSGVATALDWGLVTGLVLARAHYLLAAAVGAVAGAITDFTLKRHWAFPRVQKGALHAEGGRYLAVSSLSLVWNLAASWVLVDRVGMAPVPGVIGASVLVGVAWNYPVHRLWVFRGTARPGGGA